MYKNVLIGTLILGFGAAANTAHRMTARAVTAERIEDDRHDAAMRLVVSLTPAPALAPVPPAGPDMFRFFGYEVSHHYTPATLKETVELLRAGTPNWTYGDRLLPDGSVAVWVVSDRVVYMRVCVRPGNAAGGVVRTNVQCDPGITEAQLVAEALRVSCSSLAREVQ